MKKILFIICLLWGVAQAQTVGEFRYDSTKFWKNGGNNELIIMNSTRGVTGGVLTNTGNGRTAWALAGSTNVEGNLLYVDDVYGNNATATANRPYLPYLTLPAAKSAATAGSTIIVRPGTYSTTANLAKNGVNWYFDPGAVVTMASDADSTGIFDDGGTAMSFIVSGAGKFTRSTTDDFLKINLVNISHASSDIKIQADELITIGGTDGECSVIRQSAGKVNVNSRLITLTGGNAYAVWWFNGSMFINSSKIIAEYGAIASACNATPTGDLHVQAFEIEATLGISNTGTNTNAAFWVHSNIIRGKVQSDGLNKLYVEAQKIFGLIDLHTSAAGLSYITVDKITDVGDGLIFINGGTLYLNVDQLDPSTNNGDMTVSGGTLFLNNADYVSSATSDGLVISGGTALLTGVNLNTSANSGTSPITKSGGTLTIRNNILTGEGTVNGISAPTSQTVISYGSQSNRPLDTDVILSGDLTINKTRRYSSAGWTARVGSTTSSATPTINTDNVDIYKLTAQAANITSFTTNLSGTPNDGDILEIQITGTAARTIAWGASFVSSTVTLPATTVTTATLTVIFQWYTTSSYGNSKWVCTNYY